MGHALAAVFYSFKGVGVSPGLGGWSSQSGLSGHSPLCPSDHKILKAERRKLGPAESSLGQALSSAGYVACHNQPSGVGIMQGVFASFVSGGK